MNSGKKWQSRFAIITAGVALGYLARFVFPPEVESKLPTREFKEPLTSEFISDLPILPVEENAFELPYPIEIP